jgi:hypothetical protein
MCPQILLISARLDRKHGACSGLKGFDESILNILNWPKKMQGIQYIWNQYFEHALDANIVVWTTLGPLPRWVPGPTTRWAPGAT